MHRSRFPNPRPRKQSPLWTGLALLLAAVFMSSWRHATVSAQTPDQLTVYSSQSTYSVPLLQVNGQPYAGLVDMLEPLGSIDARPDGKKYKVRFTAPGAAPC